MIISILPVPMRYFIRFSMGLFHRLRQGVHFVVLSAINRLNALRNGFLAFLELKSDINILHTSLNIDVRPERGRVRSSKSYAD